MANIIQQFKNANGDNIFPLAYAQGGMKMDLLWTNPSPTSAFTAQTVSLDLSEYSMVIIDFYGYITNPADKTALYTETAFIDGMKRYSQNRNGYDSAYWGFGSRSYTVSTSGIVFDAGTAQNAWASAGNSDYVVIPYKIYGIKMSYIVPTSVHGLQYVEV